MVYLSYWPNGMCMQAFIHILVVVSLAMLVSYNLDILDFNKNPYIRTIDLQRIVRF
jgi:hypothetical protein